MGEFILRLIELPCTVNAVTVLDENGDYNVYVNSRLSIEEQKKAFRHEKRHIKKDHFYTSAHVSECEMEAKEE